MKLAGVAIYPGFFKQRPEPQYLDARAARFAALEHPVGDPFGGPAYGKKAMPVVAVVAAVASFATGAAVATAAGATLGAMIAGGAMMIGAALTIVGTVTGRQNLVRWGGILSLAGGLGAGYLGMTDGLTEAAASAPTVEVPTDLPVPSAPVDGTPALVDAPPVVGPESQGLLSTAEAAPPPSPAPQPAPAPAPADPSLAPARPQGPEAFQPQTADPFRTQTPAPVIERSTTAQPTQATGYFDRFGRWVQANPELARMGTQFATGLLGSVVPKPQTDLEREQTRRERLAADRLDPNSAWWRARPRGG